VPVAIVDEARHHQAVLHEPYKELKRSDTAVGINNGVSIA
jgi:hypothetical protein